MKTADKTVTVKTCEGLVEMNRKQLVILIALRSVFDTASDDQQDNGIPIKLIRDKLGQMNELDVLNAIKPLDQNKELSKMLFALPGNLVALEGDHQNQIFLEDIENITMDKLPSLEDFDTEPENVVVPDLGNENVFSINSDRCVIALLAIIYIADQSQEEDLEASRLYIELRENASFWHFLKEKSESTRKKMVGRWLGSLNNAQLISYTRGEPIKLTLPGKRVLHANELPTDICYKKPTAVKHADDDAELAHLRSELEQIEEQKRELQQKIAAILDKKKADLEAKQEALRAEQTALDREIASCS